MPEEKNRRGYSACRGESRGDLSSTSQKWMNGLCDGVGLRWRQPRDGIGEQHNLFREHVVSDLTPKER
jgi:hypothetical protein